MDFVDRKPIDAGDVEIDFRFLLNALFDLLVKNFAFVFVVAFGKRADDAPAFFAGHRKESNHTILGQTNMQRVVRKLPIDKHIRNVEQTLKGAAFKRKSEPVSHRTAWPIATHQVFSGYRLRFAVSCADLGNNAGSVLGKALKLVLP